MPRCRAELDPGHDAIRFALDADRQLRPARLVAIHHVAQMAETGFAAPSKCVAFGLAGQGLEEFFEVHGQKYTIGCPSSQHQTVCVPHPSCSAGLAGELCQLEAGRTIHTHPRIVALLA